MEANCGEMSESHKADYIGIVESLYDLMTVIYQFKMGQEANKSIKTQSLITKEKCTKKGICFNLFLNNGR